MERVHATPYMVDVTMETKAMEHVLAIIRIMALPAKKSVIVMVMVHVIH